MVPINKLVNYKSPITISIINNTLIVYLLIKKHYKKNFNQYNNYGNMPRIVN